MIGSIESKAKAGGAAREESAFNMFKQMDLRGKTKDDSQLDTVHQNTISTLREVEVIGGNVRRFASKFCLVSALGECADYVCSKWC